MFEHLNDAAFFTASADNRQSGFWMGALDKFQRFWRWFFRPYSQLVQRIRLIGGEQERCDNAPGPRFMASTPSTSVGSAQ